jgi:APA family basic amino acid/polyamine antiporter
MEQQPLPAGRSVPGATESTPSLFLRNATGLVRELSAFDAFNLVFAGVSAPLGFFETMAFAPQFWPHANMVLSFLIAAPLVLCFGLVYLYFTTLMPRSGGEYVWLSRTMSPFLGFVVNVSLTYVFLTWLAINLAIIATVFMPAVAYIAGIKAGWVASPSKVEIAVLVTVLTILFTVLMIRGVRPMAKYMFVTFIIVWVGVLAMLVIMAVGSHAGFIHSWNAHSGTGFSYTGVIAKAHGLGFSLAGGISWAATMYAMVYCFNVYTGFQWTGYFAGEIKNVRRSAAWSILGGCGAAVAVCTIWAVLLYKFYGYKFFGSLVYLGFGPGASHANLSFSPYLPQLLKFLPVGQGIAIALALVFIVVSLWMIPAAYLIATRNLFAWSFDRLAPEKLTEVSDRFHTPVASIIVIAVFIEILNLLNIYSNLAGWLLNVIWVLGLSFVIVSFAAGWWMPWRKPELHAQAPGWARHRFLGLPVITWVATVSLLGWAFVVWAAFSTGFSGSLSLRPMLESAAVPIIAIVYYIGVRLYRSRQGVNLARLFQEIPPE